MNALLNGKEVRIDETLVFTAPFQKVTTVKYTIVTAKKPAVLRVKFDYAVNSVTIRPLRYRIGYQIVDENTVDIELNGNYNFSVEPNENADNAFLVFAGKSDLLSRNNYKNILYFGYGTHFADKICIDRDSTLVYIEEGAVVHGIIRAENRKHIAVDGYGTLTMQNYSRETDRSTSIYFKFCQDVEIRNIVIKDSCNWHVNLTGCENAHIDNVKLISYRGNSDGFDICGSKNVLVENCFTRVWDDSLVVKGVDVGDIENVVFENCVLWNDFARPMELGVSIRADKMHDVVFRDIDVIHSVTGYPIMGIHHGDRAEVYDIRFENINIESTPGAQLFDLRITDSAWNRDTKKGKIHDFYFKNINLIGDPGIEILPYHSRLQGFSEEHSIRSITFDNITLLGKGVRTIEELGVDIYDYVSDVNIINGQRPYINRVLTEIIPNNFVLNEDGLYTGEVNILFKNISEVKKCGKIKLHVSPCWIGESDFDIEYSTAPGEICTVSKKITLPAGKFAFSLRSDDVDVLGSMGYVNLDLVLTESYEDSAEYSFGDSYGHMKKGVDLR